MSERLGKYTIVRQLASGGMAEIFLATQTGPGGFERSCVVKRILPQHASDDSFVRMFLAEARLIAQLAHPNIAQIQDFGEESGTYYIVMEYVAGADLRTVVRDFAGQKGTLPLGTSASIAAQVARALDHAYCARGLDGAPLQIIHRDISPHNILVTPEGVAKLIDFGVARMSMRPRETAAGVVKGKLAYMAPEQISGGQADHRTDIYALGLTLYEMLAGVRALRADQDHDIVSAVANARFRPLRSVRPELPEKLLAVVERALSLSPDARYQAASEMAAELERLVPTLGGADWSWARARGPTLELPVAQVLSGLGSAPEVSAQLLEHDDAPNTEVVPRPSAELPAAKTQSELSPIGAREGQPRSSPRALTVAAAVLAAVLAPPAAVLTLRAFAAPRAAADVAFLDGTLPVPVVRPAVVAGDAPAPAAAAAPAPGRLQVSSTLTATVRIDGESRGRAPVDLELPAGEHALGLETAGEGARWEQSVTVRSGETERVSWAPKKGSLSVRAFPWAEVFVAGRRIGVTPMAPLWLYEGRYKVRLVNKDQGREQEQDVLITAEQQTELRANLSR